MDRHALGRTVPDMALDLFSEMADAEHDTANAVPVQQQQLMIHERPAGHVDERLRRCRGDGSEPSRQPARQDRRRYFRNAGAHRSYWTMILVPSKSNRKRTS